MSTKRFKSNNLPSSTTSGAVQAPKTATTTPATFELSKCFEFKNKYDKPHPHFQYELPPVMSKTIHHQGVGTIVGMVINFHTSKMQFQHFKEQKIVEIAEVTSGSCIRIIPTESLFNKMTSTVKPKQILCISGHSTSSKSK